MWTFFGSGSIPVIRVDRPDWRAKRRRGNIGYPRHLYFRHCSKIKPVILDELCNTVLNQTMRPTASDPAWAEFQGKPFLFVKRNNVDFLHYTLSMPSIYWYASQQVNDTGINTEELSLPNQTMLSETQLSWATGPKALHALWERAGIWTPAFPVQLWHSKHCITTLLLGTCLLVTGRCSG